MELSQNGLDLIKECEGVKAEMYKDSAGLPTIGVGHLIVLPEEEYLMTSTLTDEKIDELLQQDTAHAQSCVNQFVTSEINQNQFDALVDFTFNTGSGNFRSSTLLKKINANPLDVTIAEEFSKWCHAGGEIVEGLKTRREKESQLYLS